MKRNNFITIKTKIIQIIAPSKSLFKVPEATVNGEQDNTYTQKLYLLVNITTVITSGAILYIYIPKEKQIVLFLKRRESREKH